MIFLQKFSDLTDCYNRLFKMRTLDQFSTPTFDLLLFISQLIMEIIHSSHPPVFLNFLAHIPVF